MTFSVCIVETLIFDIIYVFFFRHSPMKYLNFSRTPKGRHMVVKLGLRLHHWIIVWALTVTTFHHWSWICILSCLVTAVRILVHPRIEVLWRYHRVLFKSIVVTVVSITIAHLVLRVSLVFMASAIQQFLNFHPHLTFLDRTNAWSSFIPVDFIFT